MKGLEVSEERTRDAEKPPGFKYSMFTKTGTPLYTAPEMQLAVKYNENVDLWGAGTILYTLLMGEVPFTDTQIATLMRKVSLAQYPREGPLWEALTPEARDLISGLLCADPKKRLSAT
jgi:serine/threonine protein kinase